MRFQPGRRHPYGPRLKAVSAAAALLLLGCSRPGREPVPPVADPAPGRAGQQQAPAAPVQAPRTVLRSLPQEDLRNASLSSRAGLSAPGVAEALRPPRDYVIGALGPEDGNPAPYREAVSALNELVSGRTIDVRLTGNGSVGLAVILARLSSLGGAVAVRVGSPLPEGAGSMSFLVRLVGKDASLSGEIRMVSAADGRWLVDFLALDSDDSDAGAPGFDPLTYKRFL
jgi:hypothetical protein